MNHLNDVLLFFSPSPIFFQIQDGSWHQSSFFFHTQDSRQLPIVDIQEFPSMQPNSQRRIEIGPVCFLWHQHHLHVTYLHELPKCKAVTKNGCLPKSECPSDVVMETVNGTCQSNKCPIEGRSAWKNSQTSRPRRPKENSVYQYLSIIV